MDCSRLMQTGKPIVLYGMGNGADRVFSFLQENGLTPAGIFASDEFVRGQMFHGLPVQTYAQAKERFGDMIVLLAFGTHLPEVLSRIDRIASEQELYCPDFPVAGDQLFTEAFYEENRTRFDAVYDRLADAQSRLVFKNTVSYKLTGDISFLRACETKPEEAYENLVCLTPGDSLADLGAYRGDTAADFVRFCPSYASMDLFEPDGYTYRHLKDYANCRCWNLAASDHTGSLPFSSRGGRNSAAGKAETAVPCDSVDHALAGRPVSFFNIDVEGHERQAIAGAAETIQRCDAKLLIAAYHRSEDFFAIPEQVLSVVPEKKIYLRHFAQLPAWETNFYFI
ncbi:MAG: FkbM family methyltransferase [Clostridia bacterium]|nr:FkbM family methyltransferase [Clostridia bacterium]